MPSEFTVTLVPFTSSASWPPLLAAMAAVGTDVHWLKAVGDKAIGGGVGQDRAEVALIGVVGDQSLRPHQRLPRGSRVEVDWCPRRTWDLRPAEIRANTENHCRRQGQPEEE